LLLAEIKFPIIHSGIVVGDHSFDDTDVGDVDHAVVVSGPGFAEMAETDKPNGMPATDWKGYHYCSSPNW